MTEYVQRQITGSLCLGDASTLAQFDPSRNLWSHLDVRPSTIMKLESGKHSSGTLTLPATTGSAVIPLPQDYDTAERCAVFIFSDLTVKVVTVSPAHSTSTGLIKAGAAADQPGMMSWVGRVTSVTVSNANATAATVKYLVWEYPTDITDNDAWRDGAQTTGVNS